MRPSSAVAQVQFVETEAGVAARRFEVVLLDRARVVGDERVDADHLVALGEQRLAKMRSDESRGSCDQTSTHDEGTIWAGGETAKRKLDA